MDKPLIDKMQEEIENLIPPSSYVDIENGILDGTFTAEHLRAIADAMDRLKQSA
jgi:hypothetical protein